MRAKPSPRFKDLQPAHFDIWSEKVNVVCAELEKKGVKTINLSGSDPGRFGHINWTAANHLVEASKEGWHMYPVRSPFPKEIKKAISEFEKKHHNVEYSPDDITY